VFERYISVDWSGSDLEDRRVNLPDNNGTVVPPPDARRGVRAWTRTECRRWLAQALRMDQPRCLIAMDFGFGYLWVPMGPPSAARDGKGCSE
jgi:hypothetical protein